MGQITAFEHLYVAPVGEEKCLVLLEISVENGQANITYHKDLETHDIIDKRYIEAVEAAVAKAMFTIEGTIADTVSLAIIGVNESLVMFAQCKEPFDRERPARAIQDIAIALRNRINEKTAEAEAIADEAFLSLKAYQRLQQQGTVEAV